jgi:hypothetical protein
MVRQSDTCLSLQRPGFNVWLVHVGFVVAKVTLGQFFVQYFCSLQEVSLQKRSIFIHSSVTHLHIPSTLQRH